MESEKIELTSSKHEKETLERFRSERIAIERKPLEKSVEYNLKEGIRIHGSGIKRFEKADYKELFRGFIIYAEEKYV